MLQKQNQTEVKQQSRKLLVTNGQEEVDLSIPRPDFPSGNNGFASWPTLLTEEELVIFLRIPKVSKSKDYHNAVENLKRMHGLPRIHICGRPLYPLEEIREWIRRKTTNGK